MSQCPRMTSTTGARCSAWRRLTSANTGLSAMPARTNTPIATNAALADPAVRENFLQSAQEPIGGSVEQFSRLVRDDFEKYGRLVKELNIKTN